MKNIFNSQDYQLVKFSANVVHKLSTYNVPY